MRISIAVFVLCGCVDTELTSSESPATVSVRGVAKAATTAPATTLTLAKPSTTEQGDLMLVSIDVRGVPTIAPPDQTWTLVRSDTNGNVMTKATYYKIAGGSGAAQFTWTFSSAQNASGVLVSYAGVDTAAPIDAAGGFVTTSDSSTIRAPSITTTGNNTRRVGLFGIQYRTTIEPPNGMTEVAEGQSTYTANNLTSEVADQVLAASGATGPRLATAANARPNIGHAVALRPQAGCTGVDVSSGQNLVQVAAAHPAGTTFCIHAGTYSVSNRIVVESNDKFIGDSRTGVVIATTQADVIFYANNTEGVLIQGMTITGAQGASSCVPNCGKGIWPGRATTVRDVRLHHNENHAIGGGKAGLLVENVEIDHNGSPTLTGNSSGGIKSVFGYTITDSYIHDNTGPGVWCDVGCQSEPGYAGGFRVLNNTITNNTRSGVRAEIMGNEGASLIQGNQITGNNIEQLVGGQGGISIVSAMNVTVDGNVFGNNGRGRGVDIHDDSRPFDISGTVIKNNELNGDLILTCGEPDGAGGTVACSNNTP